MLIELLFGTINTALPGLSKRPDSRAATHKPMSQTASLPPEQEVAVFARGSNTQGTPACRMDRVGAQYQVDCRYARWVNNRYNSIIMLVEEAACKARDRSCSMGPRVIYLNAIGNPDAMALVAGWRPCLKAA